MYITKILESNKPTLSIEIYPPREETPTLQAFKKLESLQNLSADFVSITYGATGSKRDRTKSLVKFIHAELGLNLIAHLTCTGHTRKEIFNILAYYENLGIQNLLALKGDEQQTGNTSQDDYIYAIDLVKDIQNFSQTSSTKHSFEIGVAGFPEGHPESRDMETDICHLKEKCMAGSHYIITQLCFDNNELFNYQQRCKDANIHTPCIVGLMPITSKKNIFKITATFEKY